MRLANLIGCLLGAVVIAGNAGIASAKLPPPTPEQKAKADEAKAKTAHGDKVAAYKLCLSQNKVAEHYLKDKGKGNAGKPTETPACQDPGPFVPPGAAPAAPAAAPAGKTAQAAPAAAPAAAPIKK